MSRRAFTAGGLALVLGLGVATSGGTAPAGAQAGGGEVALKRLGSFSNPVYTAFAPGKKNRKLVFVVEQGGTVRVLRNGKLKRRPFLDISGRINSGGEEGLLSIAFAPDYASSRRFYAYFTNDRGNIQVSGFKRARHGRTRANPRSATKVIEIPHPGQANHNGGTVAFGPDGKLWLATGDGGSGCDPDGSAQDTSSLLGKLLRIKPKRKRGYRVPANNPFVGKPGRDEIWSLGLRNPFRFSFDEPKDALTIGDVGQNAYEEVDYTTVAGARGANFGWNAFEGTHRSGCAAAADLPADRQTPPIREYGHSGPGFTGRAITGGLVVRDPRLPALEGRYLYADISDPEVRSLLPATGGATGDAPAGFNVDVATSFTADPRGRVHVTSLTGDVYRLRPGTAGAGAADRPAEAAAGDGRGGFRAAAIGQFKNPVYVHGPSGAKGLVFVVEQAGVIRMIKNGRKLGGSFLNIKRRVRSGGERGLLSVAFSPFYSKNRRFYVFYTGSKGDLVVREYRTARRNPRDAKEGSGRTVLRIRHRFAANHNGGQLQFGPDRKLYISTGDGGGGGDPQGNGQDKRSLLGKILRIDPRRKGKRPYTVPRSNPFRKGPGAREIFALGLRNPYRFSFDRARRKIVIGDVGQERREEIDYEKLGHARGANFGWNAFEGRLPYPGGGPAPKHHERPIHDYGHGGGRCSITGGYVVRDKRIRSLFGRYLYADFCGGQIRSLVPKGNRAKGDRSAGLANQSGISSFGEDARGRIYFANLFSGKVFTIKPK